MPHLYDIDPQRPLAAQIERVRDATLVPLFARRRPLLGGVLRADKSYVQNSASYIDENRNPTNPPDAPTSEVTDNVRGHWLYGGRFDHRFGHFLVETIARLWALDHIRAPIEGIAFIQPFADQTVADPQGFLDRYKHLWGLFDGLPRAQVFTGNATFENLYVPPQGCGAGALAEGCPEFRTFARKRFTKQHSPKGGDKLYLSRSNLKRTPGQIVHEDLIEAALRKEGYEIFAPEEHSIEVQIGRMQRAQAIIGVEGSALHLATYAASDACQIGVIRRRDNQNGIINHLQSFHGNRVHDLNSVARMFVFAKSKHNISNAVLDFAELATQFRASGLVSGQFHLPDLSDDDIDAGKETLEQRVFGS